MHVVQCASCTYWCAFPNEAKERERERDYVAVIVLVVSISEIIPFFYLLKTILNPYGFYHMGAI